MAMCASDDKRYLLDDGIRCLAFGQHEILARVTDMEEDALDWVVMSQADAPGDYGKS